MSAEGIESAAESARTRSDVLTGGAGTAQAAPGALAVAAALARAAAVALDAGDVARGAKLLEDAARGLGARPPLRLVENGGRS